MTTPSNSLHLVAQIGGCGVLFDTVRVASVVELGRAVPAPGAGSAVIGLAAMRSRVATVLDVRSLLGVPPRPRDDAPVGHAVATVVDGHLYAIAVDALEDVETFDIGPVPAGAGAIADRDFVRGVADGMGETLIALDIDRLVERAAAIG
ncbi:chemotaxis protein CheW [Sphingomonas adhaesiva]|uniref:chemotaxis protein CheW n=1 Tax=Sphingomonas adhaesiva TaxID=28212 RepID=UPI002FF7F334